MCWNVQHGDAVGGLQAQVDFIKNQSPRPQVVYLEEVSRSLRDQYLNALKSATGDSRWTMYYVEHCDHFGSSGAPPCNTFKDEGIAFITTLPILSSAGTLFWGRDDYTDARAAARVTLGLDGGQTVTLFGTHLAAGPANESIRVSQVNGLKDWARPIAGPRLVTGDFNSIAPDGPAYQSMLSEYTDAWALLRPGETGSSGFTYDVKNGLDRRIDYWFVARGAAAQASTINRPTYQNGALSDHYPVTASFAIGSSGTSPFPGPSPAAIPGTIQAENFDNGANGTAYFDNTPGNSGQQYRLQSDVDIEPTADTGGGYDVGWFGPGEWLAYTVTAATTTNYTVSTRVASTGTGGRFHLEVDNVDVTGSLDVPNTGSWQIWTTVAQRGVYLTSGQHVVKIVGDAGGTTGAVGNVNWIAFDRGGTASAFPPIAIPGIVQAEEYDRGAFFDDTATNLGGVYRSEAVDLATTGDTRAGYVIGWWGPNEWMNYTVDVASAGSYRLEARVASIGDGGSFRVEIDGGNITSPAVAVPNTHGWDTWQTVSQTVTLSAGQHTLTIFAVTAGAPGGAVGNLNYLRFSHVSGQGAETVLLADNFDAASLDTSKWRVAVMSGSQDPAIRVAQSGGHLAIGPLPENTAGLHYNGILSNAAVDLTGAYASVQAVSASRAASTTTSFTLPSNGSNHYRMFVENGSTWFEKKINGVKTNWNIPYDPAQHAFWRIRHDRVADTIVFETAPVAGGQAGTWTVRHQIARELNITALRVELKGGCYEPTPAPGTIEFDSLRVAHP